MTKPALTARPTESELEILGVLWKRGPSTVREVHDALLHRATGYTTVLKLMQIMAEKGLAARDESERSHVYRALVHEQPVTRRIVRELIDQVFDGSSSELVIRALEAKPASREELAEIRALIERMEKKR